MRRKRFRPSLETLERRQLLTSNAWFVDSGQSLGTNADGADFGDLDGDGDLDLLVGCRNWPGGPACTETVVWLNDGRGQFSKGWSVDRTNIGSLSLGDLDHDGDLDAYITKGSPDAPANPTYGDREQTSEVWFNDGHGSFEDSGQMIGDAKEGAIHVVLADVDGDRDLDALLAHPTGASRVWLNEDGKEFVNSGQHLKPSWWAFGIAVGDVDQDGDIDAYVAGGHESPWDSLYLNDGDGNFAIGQRMIDRDFTRAAQLGDLDGDGDLDAFLANGHEVNGRNQPNRVLLNDGNGTFTDSGQSLGDGISTSVVLADMDGDGDLDAFVTNGTRHFGQIIDQPNEVWLNDGTGVFTLGQAIGNAASYRAVLGDVDNDGDLDAFIGNVGQDNQIWINTQVIPLQGSVQAVEVFDEQPPILLVDASGSGNASVLGRFTVTYQFEVDLPTLTGSGPAHFITANGDSLFTHVTGKADATADPNVFSIVETFTISGGTGRFSSATGNFTMERTLNNVTGVSLGSFDGTIAIKTQPLRGSIEAVENTVEVTLPTFIQNGSGTGEATHLGRFAVTYEVEVHAETFVGRGSAHFIAANGDSLFTRVAGQGTDPAVDPISTIVETHTITGGTGRFGGASGSFTVNRAIDTATGVTTGSFEGNILFHVGPIPGDANGDGVFNSADLVLVFQAGEYNDSLPGNSTFEEGDWNNDGDFNSADLVFAFQRGNYVDAAIARTVVEPAVSHRDTLVIKRTEVSSDDEFRKLDTELIDRTFEQMLL